MLQGLVKQCRLAPLSALLVIAAICPGVAAANEPASDDDTGWSGMLGAGVVHLPTYPGSPNSRAIPLPMLSVEYRDPVVGTFALDEDGLSWTFIDAHAFSVGVLLGFDAGRSAHREKGEWLSTGDNRLSGMGDLGSTLEAGAILGYGPVTIVARKALGNNGHQGFVADLEIGHTIDLSDKFALTAGVGTQWADQQYMQSWFGVTNAQAVASRFSAHTPEEGFVFGGALIGLEYRFSHAWSLKLDVTFLRLIEEAELSPLAEELQSTQVFVGIARHFE